LARVDPASVIPVTDDVLLRHPLPDHGSSTSKFERGEVLVIGGTVETPGGVLLAATAALRAGAGRVAIATVTSVARAVAVAMPEGRVTGLAETTDGAISPDHLPDLTDAIAKSDVVLIGPGMGQPEVSGELVLRIVPMLARSTRLVLDAAALPILRKCRDRFAPAERTVLLPNPGEMADLLGADLDDIERDSLAALHGAVGRFGCAIALRGGETLLGEPDSDVFAERSGHPALATSGSGDVLSGAVAGLAARGASPLAALLWGVHAHAVAGSELAERFEGLGLLARELPDRLPSTLNRGSSARQEQTWR
jgi:hydroxyethylthiazole kinase-like uncharacterized protein yjeF